MSDELNKTTKCPYCGSEISTNVKKCRYCGEWLVIQEKDKPKASFHCSVIIEAIIAIIIVIMMFTTSYSDSLVLFIIIAYIILNLYFLPTLIADKKRTQYTGAILALNLLLGFTIIVWIGCLIWAISLPDLSKNVVENKEDNEDNEDTNYLNIAIDDLCKNLKPVEKIKEVPMEIQRKFNWGALLLNWIWGVGNKSYQALWALVPFWGIIWMFVCGVKGNEWAWKNKNWSSVEDFNNVQTKWATVGSFIAVTLFLLILVICFVTVYKTDNNQSIQEQQALQESSYENEDNYYYDYDYDSDPYAGIDLRTFFYKGIKIEYDANNNNVDDVAKMAEKCYKKGNKTSEDLKHCIGINLHWF